MGIFNRKKTAPRNEGAAQRPRTINISQLRRTNRVRSDATLQGNELIYSAVSRIANTMAATPLHLYKDHQIAADHPLERLISLEPNPNFSAFRFRQTMEALRNTEGNAYALVVRDKAGQVERLDILNPTAVEPAFNKATGERWYTITLDGGEKQNIPGFMVVALSHLSANGEKGIRPLDVLRSSLEYDRQVKELSLDQLDGVNHGIMLTVPNTALTDEEGESVVDRFLEAYEKSNRSVVLLEGGLTATTFSASPVDAQLLDVERITRNRVAAVYNMPAYLVGDSTGTTLTPEQQQLQFYQQTLTPIMQQWEEELNRKLLTELEYEDGYRFRFDMMAMIRADLGTTANIYQMGIRGGWYKPNEVRIRENLPPDPNGDVLMSSRDIIPLEIPVKRPELLLQGVAAVSPAEGGESK